MRLSSSRILSVMRRSVCERNLPMAMAIGVISTRAHAKRLSNHRMSRKAPMSLAVVSTTWGKVTANVSLTVSISFAMRDVTSPECSWRSSNSRLRKSLPKSERRNPATLSIMAWLARY